MVRIFTAQRFPLFLLILFILLFVISGISPTSRYIWFFEATTAAAIVFSLVVTYPFFRFSNAAYGLMAFWLFCQLIGSHYTFAHVPFGWVTELFGFERNHFDRIAHFFVGFFAYPVAEFFTRRKLAGPIVTTLFALFSMIAIAVAYEMVEWQAAVIEGGDAGIEFIGAQGDIWDAQADILADTLGAVCALALFWIFGKRWGSR